MVKSSPGDHELIDHHCIAARMDGKKRSAMVLWQRPEFHNQKHSVIMRTAPTGAAQKVFSTFSCATPNKKCEADVWGTMQHGRRLQLLARQSLPETLAPGKSISQTFAVTHGQQRQQRAPVHALIADLIEGKELDILRAGTGRTCPYCFR